jgi:hypothetical protein
MQPHANFGIRVRGCRQGRVEAWKRTYRSSKARSKTDYGPIEVTYIKKTWLNRFKRWIGKAWKKLYRQGKRG